MDGFPGTPDIPAEEASATVEELCHYHPMGVYYYVEKKRGVDE